MKEFFTGIRNLFEAIPFIFKNKMGWTFLIPILVSILLFALGTYALSELFSLYLKPWVEESTQSERIPWLAGVLAATAGVLFAIVYFFVFAFINGYIVLVVLSPLFAWISEKTDRILTQSDYPFNWNQFFTDIMRGIMIATRNLFYELGISLLVFIITLIPIFGWLAGIAAPVFLFLLASYFYGFSFIDYNSERKRLNYRQSILLVRRHKVLSTTLGAGFYLCFLIPVIGSFFAGIVAIIATVAASKSAHELKIYQK